LISEAGIPAKTRFLRILILNQIVILINTYIYQSDSNNRFSFLAVENERKKQRFFISQESTPPTTTAQPFSGLELTLLSLNSCKFV